MTGALHPLCAPVDRGGYRPALRRGCSGPHPHTGPSEFYRKEDAADHPLVPRTPALMGNLPSLAGGWLKQSRSPAAFFGEAA